MKISFNDSANSTYEYPSEQVLLESQPSQPGDFDFPGNNGLPNGNGSAEDIPDMEEPSSSLKSTPGLGSGGMRQFILFNIDLNYLYVHLSVNYC